MKRITTLFALLFLTLAANGQVIFQGSGTISTPYPYCQPKGIGYGCKSPNFVHEFALLGSSECMKFDISTTGNTGQVMWRCGTRDSLAMFTCTYTGPQWMACHDSVFVSFVGAVGDNVALTVSNDPRPCPERSQTPCVFVEDK